jgi:hypothetical protein
MRDTISRRKTPSTLSVSDAAFCALILAFLATATTLAKTDPLVSGWALLRAGLATTAFVSAALAAAAVLVAALAPRSNGNN